MLTHMLYIGAIIAFAIALFVADLKNVALRKALKLSQEEAINLHAGYRALERGQEEIADAHYTDGLAYEARIEELNKQNEELESAQENLRQEVMTHQYELGQSLKREARLKGLLEKADEIVVKHNTDCLPLLKIVNDMTVDMQKFLILNDVDPDEVV